MKIPKLSLIIPVFNGENHLDDCLQAIFRQISGQNNEKYEVIVVNDASTDKTAKILKVSNQSHYSCPKSRPSSESPDWSSSRPGNTIIIYRCACNNSAKFFEQIDQVSGEISNSYGRHLFTKSRN